MVLPQMPSAWSGLSASALAARVTRDAMIGVEVLA
jgi:hypothetical protein